MLRSLAVFAALAVLGGTASAQYTTSAGKSAPMEKRSREVYDEKSGATAIIDRLLHRSHVIVINGPSYREWAHRNEAQASKEK